MSPDEAWSFKADIERYERLLVQVKSHKFWVSDKLGRLTKEEFQEQIDRMQELLNQLRKAAQSE